MAERQLIRIPASLPAVRCPHCRRKLCEVAAGSARLQIVCPRCHRLAVVVAGVRVAVAG